MSSLTTGILVISLVIFFAIFLLCTISFIKFLKRVLSLRKVHQFYQIIYATVFRYQKDSRFIFNMQPLKEIIKKCSMQLALFTRQIYLSALLFVFSLIIASCWIIFILHLDPQYNIGKTSSFYIAEEELASQQEQIDNTFWCYKNDPNYYFYEELINHSLLYYEYTNLNDFNSEQLETYYASMVSNRNVTSSVDINKTVEYINTALEIGILDEPEMEMDEINEKIQNYSAEERKKVPINIYKQELVCRVRFFQKNPTEANAAQVARTADDILEILKDTKTYLLEELIFYSSVATDFYLTELLLTDNSERQAYINRRLGIIFTALVQQFELRKAYTDVADYIIHFTLCAYAFTNNSLILYTNLNKKNNTLIPVDFDYYMALTLSKKIFYLQQSSKCQECGEYAMNYLESQGKKGRQAYLITCENIMIDLVRNYSEQISSTLHNRWTNYYLK